MIIVSQDKKKILNFKKTKALIIQKGAYDEISDYHSGYCILNYTHQRFILGEYSTEERAKEVLQEIITTYTGEAILEYKGYISFEMPKY